MNHKIESIAGRIGAICSSWSSVEAVSLGELSGERLLDPYFSLSFDIFHAGPIPALEERRAAFEGVGAFESSLVQAKDRFLIDGVPVRLEYKPEAAIDLLLGGSEAGFGSLLAAGTYPLYRLMKGRVLFDRSGWIAQARSRCEGLPDASWKALREVNAARLEHALADLQAAARSDDPYFYLESLALFARQAIALLFVENRAFEPSHRAIHERLRELPRLPDDFMGRWESFLRTDLGISSEQRSKIASLIAKSILSLS